MGQSPQKETVSYGSAPISVLKHCPIPLSSLERSGPQEHGEVLTALHTTGSCSPPLPLSCLHRSRGISEHPRCPLRSTPTLGATAAQSHHKLWTDPTDSTDSTSETAGEHATCPCWPLHVGSRDILPDCGVHPSPSACPYSHVRLPPALHSVLSIQPSDSMCLQSPFPPLLTVFFFSSHFSQSLEGTLFLCFWWLI